MRREEQNLTKVTTSLSLHIYPLTHSHTHTHNTTKDSITETDMRPLKWTEYISPTTFANKERTFCFFFFSLSRKRTDSLSIYVFYLSFLRDRAFASFSSSGCSSWSSSSNLLTHSLCVGEMGMLWLCCWEWLSLTMATPATLSTRLWSFMTFWAWSPQLILQKPPM